MGTLGMFEDLLKNAGPLASDPFLFHIDLTNASKLTAMVPFPIEPSVFFATLAAALAADDPKEFIANQRIPHLQQLPRLVGSPTGIAEL